MQRAILRKILYSSPYTKGSSSSNRSFATEASINSSIENIYDVLVLGGGHSGCK